jgi:hypothetical protein
MCLSLCRNHASLALNLKKQRNDLFLLANLHGDCASTRDVLMGMSPIPDGQLM